jgi:dihydrodipicolinate synthase/N-acetylneuraminate lyase
MKFEWNGIYPAITTKFKDDDTLDMEMFVKNVISQIDAGVNGIVIGGSLGEASTLTSEEKSVLVKETVKVSDGRIPVIMNISEQSTRQAIYSAAKAREDGADGLMLLPPMKYKATDYETVEYFKSVAKSTVIPIMIYNNPVDYKIEVTLDMFEQLLECENINAVKDSTRDISNITRMINRFGERFKILTGVDPLGMESLLMGADGWVAGLVCAFPHETVAIYRLIKAGRISEALKIYRWFLPLLELDTSPQLVQNIKMAEALTGMGTEIVRQPRFPLKGKERERVQAIIKNAIKNRPELPDYLNIKSL